eukprot:TRINITY_DN139017_c0_g1_i1.p1 TRINITY_DN139017_c0_g1~~TRINITY_DN139017_c0_g1_i1.p1  ORF type:complete len:314 (-),score=40.25 TRINITY_DN139017_c0_g1_i1:827-1639(-)
MQNPMKKIPLTTCLEHNRPYEQYCQTDGSSLCPLCIDKHKGHQVTHISTILTETELTQHLEKIDSYRTKLQEAYEGILKDSQRMQGLRQDLRKSVMDVLSTIHEALVNDKYYDALEDRLSKLEKEARKEFEALTNKKNMAEDFIEDLRISIAQENYGRVLEIRQEFCNSLELHDDPLGDKKEELSKRIDAIPQGQMLKAMSDSIRALFRDWNIERTLDLCSLLKNKEKVQEFLVQLQEVKGREKDKYAIIIEEDEQLHLKLQKVLALLIN